MATKGTNNDDDRDKRGRFLPGHKGGPGRKPAAVEAIYMRTLTANLTQERFAEIIQRLIKSALKGSVRAAEVLLKYTLPPQEERLRIIGDHGFRVAGMSSSELDRVMMMRLEQRIRERRGITLDSASKAQPARQGNGATDTK